jgi:hypothetical protein
MQDHILRTSGDALREMYNHAYLLPRGRCMDHNDIAGTRMMCMIVSGETI